MAQVVLGVFSTRENAEDAIDELKDEGYDVKKMSVMMRDAAEGQVVANDTGANVATGAVSGATTGAAIGALAGLLVGIGAIAIPGVGALLVGGPLAAALGLSGAAATTVSGAATGAVAGGLIGALVSLGVPEEDARVYEDRIKAGGILLAVPTRNDEDGDAKDILTQNGAEQIRTVSTNRY